MPSASFSHRTLTVSDPDHVWRALQEATTWAAIGPIESVSDAVTTNGTLSSFRFTSTVAGTRHQGHAAVDHVSAPSAMTLRLTTNELTGELSTTLTPADGGTAIEVTLTVTSRGFMSNMFFPAIRQAVGNGLPAQVDAFAASIGHPR